MQPVSRARGAVIDALLVLAALAPIVPALRMIAKTPVGRFAMFGDYASLEIQTRLVATGGTLLGPYSRFGFNHPGPLYFYALAPVYWASGGTSTALFLGPSLVAAASIGSIVVALRRLAGAAYAIASCLVLLAWWAAFGSVVSIPWNPLVVALPLLAFTVLSVLVASGRAIAAAPAILFGAFAAQTHLSCVPYVVVIVLLTALAVVLRARGAPREGRRSYVAALAVLVFTSLPALVEELLPRGGNLSKIVKLFVSRPEPPKPWGEALLQLARVSAWIPERIAARSLAKEPNDPEPMWSAPFPPDLARPSTTLAIVAVVLFVAAAVVATRRRDRVSQLLLGGSVVGALVTIIALRGIVGEPFRYLLFWGTTASTVALLGVVSTFASVGAGFAATLDLRALRSRATPIAAGIGALAIAACALFAFRLTAAAVALRGVGYVAPIAGIEPAYRALVARLDHDHVVPVIHGGPGWHVGTALQLELVKDGRPLRVVAGERWLFGRQFPEPAPGERVVHLYAEHAPYPLTTKPCLEKVTSAGEVALFFAPEERLTCPTPSAAVTAP